MRRMASISAAAAALALLLGSGGALPAQALKYGTLAGALRLPHGLTQSGAGVLLQLDPSPWLSLAVHPTWARVSGSDALGSFSSSGFTDLPLDGGVWFGLPGPLSPGLGASLGVTLPTGDTARGLGSGEASWGASVGGSISPLPRWSLSADVWRPLGGSGWATALASSHATSLSLQSALDIGRGGDAHVGFASDLGGADSSGAVRALTAGVTLPLARALAFTLDGTRGLSHGAPRWGISLGLGSAFSGLSPLGASSAVRRLGAAVGRGVNRGRGLGNAGGRGRGHK